MDTRKIGSLYDKRFISAVKKLPIIDGYYVGSYRDISKWIGCHSTTIRNIIRRFERKGIIETKRSFALFGSMNKIGIKILKDEK